MRDVGQVRNLSTQIGAVASRLQAIEYVRTGQVKTIKEAVGRTEEWKRDELAKVGGLPEIKALWAQVGILKADLEAAAKDWDNLAGVLRLAALPKGVTPEAASTMALLRDEAMALENDPSALQAALVDAAITKDWPRLHSLALGRLDENGTPLSAFRGVIQGLRLESVDLPGQEGVEADLHTAYVAGLNAQEAWERATVGKSGMTTQLLQMNAAAKFEKARFDRQSRMMRSPAEALKRAEDTRVSPGDRYTEIPSSGGCMAIFDNTDGSVRTVDARTGPAYMARLNSLTRIPPTSVLLPDVTPVLADVAVIPTSSAPV